MNGYAIVLDSWPSNITGLNSRGPLILGFFPINMYYYTIHGCCIHGCETEDTEGWLESVHRFLTAWRVSASHSCIVQRSTVHTVECLSAIKCNEVTIHATTCINFRNMLIERSWMQKDKYLEKTNSERQNDLWLQGNRRREEMEWLGTEFCLGWWKKFGNGVMFANILNVINAIELYS